MSIVFTQESEFEDAVVVQLQRYGWEKKVLYHATEAELIDNWAQILFENNNEPDRLNNCPLTSGEKRQLLTQIREARNPCALNEFINGGSFLLKRDNPDDHLHCGKEVALKIYSRTEIAAGQSRYQIVRQPHFTHTASDLKSTRRGDLLLLINGMPVIHLELKRSGVSVRQACNQIEQYSRENLFTGNLFALIQVFVAMTPDQTLYFANPGPDGTFRREFYFQWADFNNEPISDWSEVIKSLLSIPMAHKLIGFYTVADKSGGPHAKSWALKVMRSYQYYAADAIAKVVRETFPKLNHEELEHPQHGGYIWHTTGSGKTMTSFKSAQLIAASGDADKVIFLVDRIELGTQSLSEYQGFALASESVQGTDNTSDLIRLLLSNQRDDALIVTSIQKLSRLRLPVSINGAHSTAHNLKRSSAQFIDGIGSFELTPRQAQNLARKRLVIIVDECHRSTFGQMNYQIRRTFAHAIFFGFTGTPIHDENKKNDLTTSALFGNELHRYSIADGIRDHNVLGFDLYQVTTFRDSEIREQVALAQAKASSRAEALFDPSKKAVYLNFLHEVPMVGAEDELGHKVKGIEDYLPLSQYRTSTHHETVVADILRDFPRLSVNYKFHALLATSSISEALEYYELFSRQGEQLKVTCLFDPNIDHEDVERALNKEDGMERLLRDYNRRYDTNFTIPTFAAFKQDVAARLAHKGVYCGIDLIPDQQIDLLIVVDQMLTGYDSPWLNTLYLDKVLTYESVIQAFSRTNRLLDADKPFGTIKYYRKPHTMKCQIEAAVKLYSGDRPLGLFVENKQEHACKVQAAFTQIKKLFVAEASADRENCADSSDQPRPIDWTHLPEDEGKRMQFVKHFNALTRALRAAQIQGLALDELPLLSQVDGQPQASANTTTPVNTTPNATAHGTEQNNAGAALSATYLNEHLYTILSQRYQELAAQPQDPPHEHERSAKGNDVPYDLEGYITSIDTGKIDTDYMNSRFKKYLKRLLDHAQAAQIEEARQELHQSFAYLSQEEQRAASLFLSDLESGDLLLAPESERTFRDYITAYLQQDYDDNIHRFAQLLGLNEPKLRALLKQRLPEKRLDQNPDFQALLDECQLSQAQAYFEQREQRTLPLPLVKSRLRQEVRTFLLREGEVKLET